MEIPLSDCSIDVRDIFDFTTDSGYYRVNYDAESWAAIDEVLHKSPSTFHVLNRAQVTESFRLLFCSIFSRKKNTLII